MKIAVFSDVHSCYTRMAAVFQDMEPFQIDQYVCLGDVIGYGDQPEETIRLLMDKNVISVMGNHELAMFNRDYLELFPKAIKQPLIDNIVAISNQSVRYLKNMPAFLELENCHFVHGTPPDKITTYIYDVTDYYLKSLFNNSDHRIFFTGHTHKLELITYKDRIISHKRITRNCTIHLDAYQNILLNVGSIGFSRDVFDAPTYAVYDSDKKEVIVRMITV